jgi:hypothetical protein
MDILEKEAQLFTKYLVGEEAGPQAIRLYKAAMANSRPNKTDQKLLNFMVSHPASIGFIDAGLVFHNSTSEARRRLYVMFAIIEASPKYYDYFLPADRSPLYVFAAAYSGIRAVVKAGLGLLLVKVLA